MKVFIKNIIYLLDGTIKLMINDTFINNKIINEYIISKEEFNKFNIKLNTIIDLNINYGYKLSLENNNQINNEIEDNKDKKEKINKDLTYFYLIKNEKINSNIFKILTMNNIITLDDLFNEKNINLIKSICKTENNLNNLFKIKNFTYNQYEIIICYPNIY